MFYGITHIDLPVTDLSRSKRLYADVIGLGPRKSGEGWMDLDAGTVTVRLMQTGKPEHRGTLRLQVPDVDAAFKTLIGAGAKPLYETTRTPEHEYVAQVEDFDGHTITVWRELTEDEYGFEPELPKQLTWEPEAEELMKSLLKSVPASFRSLARRKVVHETEKLAKNAALVTRDLVARGYILANAKITRYRVVEPLKQHGYNPDDFRAEFLAD